MTSSPQTLPQTEEQFEAIASDIANSSDLELSDNLRMQMIAFFHGMDKRECTYDLKELKAFVLKMSSHMMTFKIHERIHEKRRAEMIAEDEASKTKAEKSKLSVVEPNQAPA